MLDDVPWAPEPNRLTSSIRQPGAVPVTGSHVFVVTGDQVLLGDVIGRGWSPPGGRTEPGETPAQTASREAWEEAGLTGLDLRFIGVWHLELLGDVPADYPFPSPHSVQTVFGAQLPAAVETSPVFTVEVTSTRWFHRADLDALPGSRQWLPLLDAYLRGAQQAHL